MKLIKNKLITLISLLSFITAAYLSSNSISYAADVQIRESEWVELKEKEIGVTTHSTAVVNGKVYVFCGYTNSGNVRDCYSYDISTNTWSSIEISPRIRTNAPTVVVGNKIYVIGGSLAGSSLSSDIDIYNTTTGSWETGATLPQGLTYSSAVAVGEKIYIIGGKYYSSESSDVICFNTSTKTFETKASLPFSLQSATAQVFKDEIFVLGGTSNSAKMNALLVYNIKNNTWETRGNLLVERSSPNSALIGDKIYLFGGLSNSGRLNSMDCYDITNNTWSKSVDLPFAVSGMGAGVYNDAIYVIGGYDGSNRLGKLIKFKPLTKEEIAEDLVNQLEQFPTTENLSFVRDYVNLLDESATKDILQDRINSMFINSGETIPPQSKTLNSDIYLKMPNTLSLSLDTNYILFDNFDGVEDLEKRNAINLTVNSSLPYKINASLETEIENSDKSLTLDKSVLGIKANSESSYNIFTSILTPVTLLDNQPPGTVSNHGIDIKLKGGIINKVDVYKAVIKFEVVQK